MLFVCPNLKALLGIVYKCATICQLLAMFAWTKVKPKLLNDSFYPECRDLSQAWAGLGSDISYYLNSHHVDLHCWAMAGVARCLAVSAVASSGVVAEQMLGRPCEDTITLTAEWENIEDGSRGHAVYTASWTAAKA